MNQPRWLTWTFVTMAMVTLATLLLCHCGGSDSSGLFDPSLGTSPVNDGGSSEGSLAGSDGAHDPGLDAADAGEFRGEAGESSPANGPPDATSTNDAFPLDSHISDPWPADVVVERMPAPNCFVDFSGQLACCFARNQPPVDCERQNSPHYCEGCPK